MRLAACVTAVALVATSAAAGDEDACNQEDFHIVCDEYAVRLGLESSGFPPAETYAEGGGEGVRFFINTYYGPEPAITVLRRPGQSPVVEIRPPAGEHSRDRLSGPAGQALWQAVEDLDAPLGPPGDDEVLIVCADSAGALVERWEGGRVVRRNYNSCDDGEIFDRLEAMRGLAKQAIPQCDRLKPLDPYGAFEARRLYRCFTLHGESPVAAAEIANRIEDRLDHGSMRVGDGPRDDLFETNVRLEESSGRTAVGREAVNAAWFDEAFQAGVRLRLDYVEARAAEGSAFGTLSREQGDKVQRAQFVQDWRRGEDGVWRLHRWVVGDYYPPADD